MKLFTKVIAVALLGAALSGAVMAAIDVNDVGVIANNAKLVTLRGVMKVASVDNLKYKITFDENLVDSLASMANDNRFTGQGGQVKNLMEGLKGIYGELATAAGDTGKLKVALNKIATTSSLESKFIFNTTKPLADYTNKVNHKTLEELRKEIRIPIPKKSPGVLGEVLFSLNKHQREIDAFNHQLEELTKISRTLSDRITEMCRDLNSIKTNATKIQEEILKTESKFPSEEILNKANLLGISLLGKPGISSEGIEDLISKRLKKHESTGEYGYLELLSKSNAFELIGKFHKNLDAKKVKYLNSQASIHS